MSLRLISTISDKISKIPNIGGFALNLNARRNGNELQNNEMFGKIAMLSHETEKKLPSLDFHS